MDLRSGCPYWLMKNGLLATYPPLSTDASCDVAVIGGGVTGALVAYALTKAGIDTIVLDRRDVASGSTAASTALLQYATDTELVDLVDLVGEETAVRSYRLGLEAVAELGELVREVGDPCSFETAETAYLASKKSHVEKLRREYQLRARHGFSVEFFEADQVAERFPFAAPAVLLTQGDAQIDAYRFTHALLAAAAKKGLRIFDRTEVTDIEPDTETVRLSTARDTTVTARRIVFATGYESQKYLRQKVGSLYSTYAFITEPIAELPRELKRLMLWETARPYFYLRTTDDGRILAGGEDTSFGSDHRQERRLARKVDRLIARLKKLIPSLDYEVAYRWAGTFGTTGDGLPYIGRSEEWPLGYFALGYGGNGITMSVVAARLITDEYLGRSNPDAALFRFDR